MKILSVENLPRGFFVFALVGISAHAGAGDLSSIFGRGNRTLEPPARELKSTRENFDYRLKSEEKRFASSFGSESNDSTTESITVTTEPVSPVLPSFSGSRSTSTSRRGRKSRSRGVSDSGKVEAFSGDRVFALGIVGAGAYGIYGTELEFAFDDRLSFGAGLGTGMAYSSWGLHGKYFFNQSGRIETFLQAGYANWYMSRAPSSPESSVNYLAERFFFAGDKTLKRSRVDLLYPAVGMLAQFQSGLALSWQLQYLIALHDFSGGLFGAVALHFYF